MVQPDDSANSGNANPALLEFAWNFAIPPVKRASMRHKSGIRRSCFFPVYAPYVRMLKLHNHYLKPNVFSHPEDEYWFIRNSAGLLDVTGEEVISIDGPDALMLMNSLIPRDLEKLANGKAMYCVMCYDHGGIVEDAILVRFSREKFWWVGGPGYSESNCQIWCSSAESSGDLIDICYLNSVFEFHSRDHLGQVREST